MNNSSGVKLIAVLLLNGCRVYSPHARSRHAYSRGSVSLMETELFCLSNLILFTDPKIAIRSEVRRINAGFISDKFKFFIGGDRDHKSVVGGHCRVGGHKFKISELHGGLQ